MIMVKWKVDDWKPFLFLLMLSSPSFFVIQNVRRGPLTSRCHQMFHFQLEIACGNLHLNQCFFSTLLLLGKTYFRGKSSRERLLRSPIIECNKSSQMEIVDILTRESDGKVHGNLKGGNWIVCCLLWLNICPFPFLLVVSGNLKIIVTSIFFLFFCDICWKYISLFVLKG